MKNLSIYILFNVFISCNNDPDIPETFVPKNGRTIAIDINEGAGDYNSAFISATELGIEEVKLSWDWDVIETANGFDLILPDIANIYYPSKNMPVTLIFRPVNTNLRSIPDELKSLELDDPVLISRFNAFLDSMAIHTPDLSVNGVFIGNEIDIYLGDDQDQWLKFSNFFKSTSAHARELWGPSVNIGSIATLDALKKDNIKSLMKSIHDQSDVVAVTYYPFEGDFQFKAPALISGDFDRIAELYGHMEIRFIECGYSTSSINGSSEELQKQFVEEIFKSWDKHESVIRHIDFTWLHDLSIEEVDELKQIYGISTETFGEYLRTLGFKTFNGQDKPGYTQLKEEALKRGW